MHCANTSKLLRFCLSVCLSASASACVLSSVCLKCSWCFLLRLVSTADSNDCRIVRPSPPYPPPHPASSSGQLASVLALETKCGSPERPWIIEVPQGQRINLTLIDFTARRATPPPPPQGAGGGGASRCVRYAKVMEKSVEVEGDKSFVICGRSGRERSVYSSKGHVVRVVMEMDEENPNYFLIGYRGMTSFTHDTTSRNQS